MKGWLILGGAMLVGAIVGVGAATKGPAVFAPYLPTSVNKARERIEGDVVRKQRDGNRLLVKVMTAQGPMLAVFTEKVADLDVLLDPGDMVTLLTTSGYATFIEDPILERLKAQRPAATPQNPTP
jgi:hypothetical protein